MYGRVLLGVESEKSWSLQLKWVVLQVVVRLSLYEGVYVYNIKMGWYMIDGGWCWGKGRVWRFVQKQKTAFLSSVRSRVVCRTGKVVSAVSHLEAILKLLMNV